MTSSGYWDYYRTDFDWNDKDELVVPDLELTRARFSEIGYNEVEIEAFVRSGYVVHPIADTVVVDRFYGGALASTDERTRIAARDFRQWFGGARNYVACHKAKSLSDVVQAVDKLRSQTHRRLLFRGQTAHYDLPRERPNPSLSVAGVGEPSFLPSLWRELWKSNPTSFRNFTSPREGEWQSVFSHRWPIGEIHRRFAEINAAGGWIHSHQDMEDSDDPLLKAYGRLQLDIAMGARFNLADTMNTLLQHYGLLSPYLDLTDDLDVALFFATNRFVRDANGSRYEFVGGNSGRALVYVFREDRTEMSTYGHERIVELMKPLRPVRQSCVVCRSAPFALNLCGDFLTGVIELDFDVPVGRLKMADLFPNDDEDLFLAALKTCRPFAERVTDFGAGK